ncbi:MAG: hypothetical protein ACI85I_002149 [Arenicella sp.]|jgi:hypothetical protein
MVKYLYKEMSEIEKEAFVPEVFRQEDLQNEFNEMLNMKEQLDNLTLQPSQKCIDSIMEFARL